MVAWKTRGFPPQLSAQMDARWHPEGENAESMASEQASQEALRAGEMTQKFRALADFFSPMGREFGFQYPHWVVHNHLWL